MKIFLTGFMGSGKTHIGEILARQLGFAFSDMDLYMEKKVGMSVPAIFETMGENEFRNLERAALESLIGENMDMVISTGGGAPCFFDNMQKMNDHGLTVFLDPSTSVLVKRLVAEIQKRPVLKGQTSESLAGFIETLMLKRRKYYEQSQLIIQSSSSKTIVTKIISYLKNHYTLNLK